MYSLKCILMVSKIYNYPIIPRQLCKDLGNFDIIVQAHAFFLGWHPLRKIYYRWGIRIIFI